MTISPAPQQNHLFAALSADARNRLLPGLELVYLPLGKVLYAPDAELSHVIFHGCRVIFSPLIISLWSIRWGQRMSVSGRRPSVCRNLA